MARGASGGKSGGADKAIPENLIPSYRKGVQSGPEQSRARLWARAKRSLDGEDRSERVPIGRNGDSLAQPGIFITIGG